MVDDSDSTLPMAPMLSEFAAYGATEQLTRPTEVSARLVCVAGPDLGASFRVGPGENIIGRTAAIRLSATDVSRNHARLTCERDTFTIEDLGSTNRTKVNGAEITGRTPLRYGDRVQVGATLLVLTHHDELELRVQQLQRLDAMTTAVSGLAHDFNNALMIILAGVDLLEQELPRELASPREQLHDIHVAAKAAVALASRLVKLGHGGALPPQDVELADLVREVLGMVRHVTDTQRISLSSQVPPGFRVRCSRDELQQALLNLCLNARDAMPDGGAIRIDAQLIRLDRATAASHLLADEGAYVELSVRDTGTGMSEAVAARIFEPFFTTKPPGKGSGLGLAMTHVTIKRHGGSISVESKPGVGTTFRILLPASR